MSEHLNFQNRTKIIYTSYEVFVGLSDWVENFHYIPHLNNVSNRNIETNRISVKETYSKSASLNTEEMGCEHRMWLRIDSVVGLGISSVEPSIYDSTTSVNFNYF